jgi:hypothetical protein
MNEGTNHEEDSTQLNSPRNPGQVGGGGKQTYRAQETLERMKQPNSRKLQRVAGSSASMARGTTRNGKTALDGQSLRSIARQ